MGTWPVVRGQETGSLPSGFASPKRISAMALPPSVPGYQASRIAGTCPAAHEMFKGRPLRSTSTTGFPVATTASSNCCWLPGRSIKGRKDWVPYEQAGFVYRRFKNHGVGLEAVSKEIGLSLKQVMHLIDTYQFMIDHDEIEVGRWSYYDEYLKSAKITKAKKKYPELDKMIVKKIKSAEIL